jgi:hypothetical protein
MITKPMYNKSLFLRIELFPKILSKAATQGMQKSSKAI